MLQLTQPFSGSSNFFFLTFRNLSGVHCLPPQKKSTKKKPLSLLWISECQKKNNKSGLQTKTYQFNEYFKIVLLRAYNTQTFRDGLLTPSCKLKFKFNFWMSHYSFYVVE